ncbi:TRAP transporter large permease [Bacillus sp. B15-48]|uniref:TRAP transporter large permease n=1 Tax=Bacillus sp. B15-48 TaxID=1548601 RepID=UPI00193F1277|nr:TRAP transporter large permease [Bacillus sp. B15-48]MBM4763324.1 TRAP transporter large permease subunit [Bacillus sp. B15-48]
MMVFLSLILLIGLLLIGMPIGMVLLVTGSIGMITTLGTESLVGFLSVTAYRSVSNYTLVSIPLFILMAHFISKSKVADDFFDCILKWIGHLPGGTGIATVFGSAGFGTLSGSSLAATSVMSQIAVPKMVQSNYSPSFSSGLVASSTGTLAVMIPPSIPLILYGIQTETSIGQLLVAGILPGILLALLLCLTVFIVGIKQNSRTEKFSYKERFKSLIKVIPTVLLVAFVISVIYFGIATPSESAAFGAFGALILGLVYRKLNMKSIMDCLIDTVKQTSMIFIIVVGSYIFSYYITMTRIGVDILTAIKDANLSPYMVLLFVILVYLALGMFMDLFASLLLTLPIVFPLITGLGFDPLWLGVFIVLLLEIGLVTPPVGINLFVTSQQSGVPVEKVFYGSIPFIFVLLLTIVLLIVFPQIVTFLPYSS